MKERLIKYGIFVIMILLFGFEIYTNNLKHSTERLLDADDFDTIGDISPLSKEENKIVQDLIDVEEELFKVLRQDYKDHMKRSGMTFEETKIFIKRNMLDSEKNFYKNSKEIISSVASAEKESDKNLSKSEKQKISEDIWDMYVTSYATVLAKYIFQNVHNEADIDRISASIVPSSKKKQYEKDKVSVLVSYLNVMRVGINAEYIEEQVELLKKIIY